MGRKMYHLRYLLTSILFCAVAVAQTPSITISPSSWELGTVSDTKNVSRVFSVHNSFPYTVKFGEVNTSCSCNAVFDLPPSLNADEKRDFTVILNPTGKMGRYVWEVTFETDSPDAPSVVLPIRVLVQRDALLSEPIVRLKPFFMGDPLEKKVWVASRHKPDFKIFSAGCTAPGFDVQVTASPVEGFYEVDHGYLVLVSTRADISPGTKKGEVILHTDLPEHETIRIPFFACVNGYIRLSPAYLAFGLLEPGHVYHKTVRVSHDQLNSEFHIVRMNSSIPELALAVKPLIADHFYEIEVTWTVPENAAAGECRGLLEIHTDFAGQPLVALPVQGIVFPKPKK